MNEHTFSFNPKIHICKFGFELYDHALFVPYEYKILADLYLMEISVLFTNKRNGEIIDNVGFKISPQKLSSLLASVQWDDFEKMRNMVTPPKTKKS